MTEPTQIFAARPWADRAAEGPARRVPTMLTEEERQYYAWLCRDWMQGAGEVVDLGCFAGGSTAWLATGHAAAGHPGLVHAFDFFTVSEDLKAALLYPAGIAPFKGEDMLALSRALLEPWDARVTFHRGNLLAKRWPAEDPVEILVIDAAKSTALADHIARQFFPALIPGRSVVVQQDFLHRVQPWLPAQMELFAEFFEPLAHLPDASVSFLCRKVPSAGEIAARQLEGRDDAALTALIMEASARLAPLCPAPRFARQCQSLAEAPGTRLSWKFPRG
ncbi:hypothetical protein V8J36_12160 [Frigidibacter sp. MR17.14]|uniref:hypothetical protein n=1 Tax=Frigidibacter sp. MR17.14 TaxID=3126509 RepID=UPI0030129EC3